MIVYIQPHTSLFCDVPNKELMNFKVIHTRQQKETDIWVKIYPGLVSRNVLY